MSLNGTDTPLVFFVIRHSGGVTTSTWVAQDDDGAVIQHVSDSSTVFGAYSLGSDYWTVTERDGTGTSSGCSTCLAGLAATRRPIRWTRCRCTPAHSGDPCYSSSGFTSSVCTMAYVWHLDYVTDTHAEAMAYYYTQTTNYYGRTSAPSDVAYISDSYPTTSPTDSRTAGAYGTVPDKVVFTAAPRCVRLDLRRTVDFEQQRGDPVPGRPGRPDLRRWDDVHGGCAVPVLRGPAGVDHHGAVQRVARRRMRTSTPTPSTQTEPGVGGRAVADAVAGLDRPYGRRHQRGRVVRAGRAAAAELRRDRSAEPGVHRDLPGPVPVPDLLDHHRDRRGYQRQLRDAGRVLVLVLLHVQSGGDVGEHRLVLPGVLDAAGRHVPGAGLVRFLRGHAGARPRTRTGGSLTEETDYSYGGGAAWHYDDNQAVAGRSTAPGGSSAATPP